MKAHSCEHGEDAPLYPLHSPSKTGVKNALMARGKGSRGAVRQRNGAEFCHAVALAARVEAANAEGVHRSAEALENELSLRLYVNEIFDRSADVGIDQDLTIACFVAQS